jgi:hypothetical protein
MPPKLKPHESAKQVSKNVVILTLNALLVSLDGLPIPGAKAAVSVLLGLIQGIDVGILSPRAYADCLVYTPSEHQGKQAGFGKTQRVPYRTYYNAKVNQRK